MQKPMRSAKNVFKILITLLVIAVSILVIQAASREKYSTTQAMIIATNTSETGLILEIPQKALWRNYVRVSAETKPGSLCELLYVPPSGVMQEFSSVADENGKCAWKWKIEEKDGKGNGRLIFTIDGKSETHFIEIRRSF
jgi:hypothetical protein